MDAILEPIREALGGGQLTMWLILGGIVAGWLALKAVKAVIKLALGVVAATLVLGTAPWAGSAVPGAPADCAAAAVSAAASGWQTNLTKRVTTEELSTDATCANDGVGLSAGSAVVRLRTFYDLPFQTWDVTPDGPEARFDLPTQ